MNFLYSYYTNKGNVKATNQDSLLIEKGQIGENLFHLFVVCDGMGGLEKGEVASAELIHAFSDWFQNELPGVWQRAKNGYLAGAMETELRTLLDRENKKIANYGRGSGIHLGTTVSAMLTINDIFFLIHVGDSRIYEVTDVLTKLTVDHSLVEQEIALGRLTAEEAEKDSRRNVLLQCIGASDVIRPQFLAGTISENAVYLLCTDGFRHELSPQELLTSMSPSNLFSVEQIAYVCQNLTQTVMGRGEEDNITVVAARSYEGGK